ncbi:Peptidyl-prolyl cis-trans isomerase PpiD [Minicystis rosea]|nr:Peptidyl-prolyl cis-trans isomerase PpiD [Minicystis rosea]
MHGSCAVTATEFQAAYRLVAWNFDPGRLKAMGLRRHVADGLLERWLLTQDAKRLGISISDDDLTAELGHGRAHVSLPAADMSPTAPLGRNLGLGDDMFRVLPVKNPKTKKYDPKVYDKQVRQITRLSTPDFRAYQREEIVAARMRDLIRGRARIGENEAFEQYARDKSSVTLDYARFDRRFYADLVVDQSPKAIEAWADAHKDDLDKVWEARKAQILPECRSVREIVFKLDGTTATDEEKAKVKARIERAKDRLAKGEDFADVARSMSDGTTANRGGEVGCLLKGKAPKPLEDAVNALAAGKVSDVVTTEHALYLLKIDTIAKDADAEKLGRLQTARELYVTQEADRLALEASKKVSAAAKGGKSLKDALDQYLAELAKTKAPAEGEKKKDKKADEKKADKGDKKADEKKADEKKVDEDREPLTIANHPNRPTLETTMPFNIAGEPITGVRSSAELTKIAFGLEKPGDAASDALAFEDGYLSIALKEKAPASKESWEKEREYYVANMRAYKASDSLTAYVKRLQSTLASDAKYTKELVEEPKGQSSESGPAPLEDDGE